MKTTKCKKSKGTRSSFGIPSARRMQQHQQKHRCGLEQLESRELFVVGAFAPPDAIVPGSGFDGVVEIDTNCTGTLLESGRHILTAAHCVDDGVPSYNVRFDMPGGPITQNVPSSSVAIHPSYSGGVGDQFDIAIMTLTSLAPSGELGETGAERYDIYRDFDTAGRAFTMVGYGRTGTGLNGDNMSSSAKRAGGNRFYNFSSDLIYDFDVPGLGGGLANESMIAPGDSGGPSFLDGKIAGVHSWISWPGGKPRASFGSEGHDVRVALFANWIDTRLDGSYDLVLDMNSQVVGNDGQTDTINVFKQGGNLRIQVNGETYHVDDYDRINSVTILGSSDADQIYVSDKLDNLVVNGRGGSDLLRAPDINNAWVVDGNNSGAIGNWATFTRVENLKGGNGEDIFSIHQNRNVAGMIDGGGGIDTLDYMSHTTGVSVNLMGSATGTGGVQSIENVKGGSGNDTIWGSQDDNRLIGGSGIDRLYGRGGNDILEGGADRDFLYGMDGRDLMIGGDGADFLYGGNHDDILIAGNLQSTENRLRVMDEWTRTDSSASARVFNLKYSGGWIMGNNGNHNLNSGTVENSDGANDSLTGGTGTDWFWGDPSEVNDRQRGDFLNMG